MSDLKPHEAGYMKPPRHGQFKKGQSGNPEGRPKKIDDPFTTLEKVLARRITLTGQEKRMTIREALVRRLRERTLAGERRALALHQKIVKLAAEVSPPKDQEPDTTAAKLQLAEMAGISRDDPDDPDDPDAAARGEP